MASMMPARKLRLKIASAKDYRIQGRVNQGIANHWRVGRRPCHKAVAKLARPS